MYEIAKYIPLRERRKMVAVKYRKTDEGRMCSTGRCPMGWLFADPPKGRLRQDQLFPRANTIARRIKRLFPSRTKNIKTTELAGFADAFTSDWDHGKIKNLHNALGVPKDSQKP